MSTQTPGCGSNSESRKRNAPAPEAVDAEMVWDEAAEATAEWMANNPGPSGIPHDPPTNPYRASGVVVPAQPEPALDGPSFGDYWPAQPDAHHAAQPDDGRPVHYRTPAGSMVHALHNLSRPPKSTDDWEAVTCDACLTHRQPAQPDAALTDDGLPHRVALAMLAVHGYPDGDQVDDCTLEVARVAIAEVTAHLVARAAQPVPAHNVRPCGSCGEPGPYIITLHGGLVPACLRHLNHWRTPADNYTCPTACATRNHPGREHNEWLGQPVPEPEPRGEAEVKAEALREAAFMFSATDSLPNTTVQDWLRDRADRLVRDAQPAEGGERPGEVVNLLAALQRSLDAAKATDARLRPTEGDQ